ncbi:hypothetical protein MP228_009968 [Amoeboaphelidium protococcarum]|nr:hypothetical protein MP228_009968 [Amoeboaphelidium protococcarum]
MADVVHKMMKLIEMEREYAISQVQQDLNQLDAQSAQKKGISLLNMRPVNQRVGLGGKLSIDFEHHMVGHELPQNQFRPGDRVELLDRDIARIDGGGQKRADELPTALRAVVHRVNSQSVTLILDREVESDQINGNKYRINKLVDDVSYARMQKALQSLESVLKQSQTQQISDLIRVAFSIEGQKPLFTSLQSKNDAVAYINPNLNESQKEAIQFALTAQSIALILGPPGSGKTTTVLEIIKQLVVRSQYRLLVCAPSNVAVDNLVERMAGCEYGKTLKFVRIGHPSRMLPDAQPYALDTVIKTSDSGQLVQDIRVDIEKAFKQKAKAKSYSDKKVIQNEIRSLRKDLRQREPKLISTVLDQCQIVFSTLSGAGSRMLQQQKFDFVIIDEVSQSLEPECWIALLKGDKAILAGDPHQLPPTVLCPKAAREGLETTIYDRLYRLHGESIQHMLNVQYRMNKVISDWSSNAMYGGRLISHDSVKDRLLCDLESVQDNEDTNTPLVMYDTSNCHLYESIEDDDDNSGGKGGGESKYNEGESKLVLHHIQLLTEAGVDPAQIAVISPYNAQVHLLKRMLLEDYPQIEIGSIDSYQGREKDVVILSLVRSNDQKQVGFLVEKRRLNVAITRAKYQAVLICDAETVSNDKFMKEMVEYFNEHADLRYAYTILDDV